MSTRLLASNPVTAPHVSVRRLRPRVLTRKQGTVIAWSVAMCTVGAMFGDKLSGRLAVSNVVQVAAVLLLLTVGPRVIGLRDVLLGMVTLAGIMVAATFSIVTNQIMISFPHVLYFLTASLLLVIWIRTAHRYSNGRTILGDTLAKCVVPVALIALSRWLIFPQESKYASFGLDDKSHAAVYLMTLAVFFVIYRRSPYSMLVSVGMAVIALTSISRLAVIFIPALAIAVGATAFSINNRASIRRHRNLFETSVPVRRVRRPQQNRALPMNVPITKRGTSAGRLAVFICIVGSAWLLRGQYLSLFPSLGRALASSESQDVSTAAHLELIRLTWALKMDSLSNFIFGVTPGGFSNALVASNLDLSYLSVVDPQLYLRAHLGTAPTHTTWGGILIEFPIFVSLFVFVVMLRWVILLLRRRSFDVLVLLLSFITATTFYSTVNELLFFVCVLAIFVVSPVSNRGRAELSISGQEPR